MTLVCTISIGKVFNSVLNFISVLMYNSVLMHNSVLMYGSVITNPGQNATGQNVTKRKPEKMPQNKNASKL